MKIFKSLLVCTVLFASNGLAADADLVVIGSIRTMSVTNPKAEGMAIKDGKIIYIGTAEKARKHLAAEGTLVELSSGDQVLPGFVDAHIHMLDAGILRRSCMMEEPASKAEVLEIIADFAKNNPNITWITGSGWPPTVFEGGNPRKEDLDEIVPNRPVMLFADDGHSSWLNSKALALLNITKDTPDPARGRIERDPKTGEPTGALREDAAYEADAKIPKPDDQFMIDSLKEAQLYLHGLGITQVQDAYATPRTLEIYGKAAKSGELTMKVVAAQVGDPSKSASQVDDLIELRDKYTYGHLRADTVKIMMDGVMEAKTAALLMPYVGTDYRGILNWDSKNFASVASRLDREGFQVHIHAIGDYATRTALDGLQAVRDANGPSKNRPHIAHLELIDPADIPRFHSLGITANFQPYWCYADTWLDETTEPFIGAERATRLYQMASVLAPGTRLALGSDWPVSSPNPFMGMMVGATRQNPKKPDSAPWMPKERVPLETLLAAYTIGGAWINRNDKETGSLEVGKAADFIIVDRDILATPVLEVGKTQVLSTYIDGKLVYRRDSGSSAVSPTAGPMLSTFHHRCPCNKRIEQTDLLSREGVERFAARDE
jgi:predicted amidohydrolase YtcJ